MNPITKDILIWFDNMNGANTTKNDYSWILRNKEYLHDTNTKP